MPCRDPIADEEAEVQRGLRMQGLTLALCLACKTLADAGKLPAELRGWYRAHTASDNARMQAEEAESDVATMRASLVRRGLDMRSDHKLLTLRNKSAQIEQRAYEREREVTLELVKLAKKEL